MSGPAWFHPAMLVGVTAGVYRLEWVVGYGGFGAVYSTRDSEGTRRAVKVLYPPNSHGSGDMRDHARRQALFLNEIAVAARFASHPNIMNIRDTGFIHWQPSPESIDPSTPPPDDGAFILPYYVTDFLTDSVDCRIQDGLMNPEEAVRIALQICDALEALHGDDPSFLHLDLSPANVRMKADGTVVLTDFGLVQKEQTVDDETAENFLPAIVVTPEQAARSELDHRTDIYQVGALLFYMLTGEKRLVSRLTTLHQKRPDSPDNLNVIIDDCTRNDKELRYQEVVSLRNDLATVRLPWWSRHVARPYFRARTRVAGVESHVPPPLRVWRSQVAWVLTAMFAVWFSWSIGWIFPPEPIKISIASSSTKKEWLTAAVNSFFYASRNDPGYRVSGNLFRLADRPIEVEILLEEIEDGVFSHWRSGSMIRAILSDDSDPNHIEPTIASPADQTYIFRLREGWRRSDAERQWSAKTGKDLSGIDIVGGDAPDLLATPLVFAMWESHARALGCWPESGPNCSWKTLTLTASDPSGWGLFGHSEWGTLQYGLGRVGSSNSATLTQVLICISGAGKTSGLVIGDVGKGTQCGEAMAAFNAGDIKIFEKSEWALTDMLARGPEFLDAVTTYEEEVIEKNRSSGFTRSDSIVTVYPNDGTVQSTHPFAILGSAPWVTSDEARAAEVFLDYLLSEEQQIRVAEQGMRPVHPNVPPRQGFLQFGANVQTPLNLVELPDPEVVDAIVAYWKCLRAGEC